MFFLERMQMNTLALLFERPESFLLIVLIIILLFGSSRIPQVARSLGRSVSEFKKGVREGEEEEKKAVEPKEADKKPG
ncbi:MAG: twin-arginine translocase TatA/TatE family subunit [Candidatus Brocadiia bacterium]